jgi:lipopolysaccharide biosynthesis glycosyltransferase
LTVTENATFNCPLVFACDTGYAMPLATTLRSLAETNRGAWPLQIHILSDGFSKEMETRIVESLPQGSCAIRWAPIELTLFAGLSTLRHISSMTYARLLLASILPEGTSRALYLDVDILVLDSLKPLLELDLDGAVMGAVLDERVDTHIKMGNTSLAGWPLPNVADYFNAGVLLIDVARWRAERISEKALDYLKRCPHTLFMDQDALNIACDGAWKKLDPRWNYFQIDLENPLPDLSPAQRPGIIHFHGSLKPWDPRALNLNAGFYNSFRARTLFARTLADKFGEVPIVMWSRFKRSLKRSGILTRARNRLHALYLPGTPKAGRRLSA